MKVIGRKLCYGVKGTVVTWHWGQNPQAEEDSMCISDWLWVIIKCQKTDLHMEVQGDCSVITDTATSQVVVLPLQSVFSSSLENPERSQYSICHSALEPFISTLCAYVEEKKITHKHKHITAGRDPTRSCTTLIQPPTSLSHCTLGRTLCALGGS